MWHPIGDPYYATIIEHRKEQAPSAYPPVTRLARRHHHHHHNHHHDHHDHHYLQWSATIIKLLPIITTKAAFWKLRKFDSSSCIHNDKSLTVSDGDLVAFGTPMWDCKETFCRSELGNGVGLRCSQYLGCGLSNSNDHPVKALLGRAS